MVYFFKIQGVNKKDVRMLSKLKPKDQTVNCPQCNSTVYVPLKFDKKIRVTCKKCRFRFELQMNNPITQNMNVKKTNTFKENVIGVFAGLKSLPWTAKLLVFLLIIMGVGLAYVLGSISIKLITLLYGFVSSFFAS